MTQLPLPTTFWIYLLYMYGLLPLCVCIYVCMYVYIYVYVCMYVYHVCAWYLWESEEGVISLGIGVMDGCEPSCGCWESNLGPLQE